MSLSIPDAIKSAIQDIRNDKTTTNYCVATYDSNTSLKLVSSGDGGVDALRDSLVSSDVCYALLRREFSYETVGQVHTENTKFVFVYLRPDAIPIKRKMKIGVFDGQVKKVFQPYHVDVEVATPEEINDEVVQTLLMNITSRADHKTDKKSTGYYVGGKRMSHKDHKQESDKAKMVYDTRVDSKSAAPAKGATVNFPDMESLKAALADVRNDGTSTQWCLFGYEGKNDVVFVAKGDGSVDELLGACQGGQVNYGLFRVTEQIDNTKAIKFCFVVWTPDDVHPMTKARVSTHKGSIAPLFRPYHVDFFVTQKSELNVQVVNDHITGLSGTRSHVTDRKATKEEETYERKMLGGVTKDLQKLKLADEDQIKAAIASVRDNGNDATWALAGYEGKGKDMSLCLVKTGTGDADSLAAELKAKSVMYAIYRSTQVIDKSETVKFLFVHFQAEDVSPSVKGATGVLKGAVSALFAPFHAEVFASTPGDLTNDTVKNLFKDKQANW